MREKQTDVIEAVPVDADVERARVALDDAWTRHKDSEAVKDAISEAFTALARVNEAIAGECDGHV